MMISKARFERFNIPDPYEKMEVLKHLERIGRVCYKSEDKITDESCLRFIKNLRDRKHWAMLEHYIFVFSVSKEIYDDIVDSSRFTPENDDLVSKMPFISYTYWEDAPEEDLKYIISASATALNYLWECNCYKNEDNLFIIGQKMSGMFKLCNFMMIRYPELMKDPMPDRKSKAYYMPSDIHFISRERLASLPRNIRMIHDWMSVKFTVDRGITHELVRHRPASWAQESTRYCNYSSGKFGREINVIDPVFFDPNYPNPDGLDVVELRKVWNEANECAQKYYSKLIELGATPQQARSVLPNDLKAEIVMTARMFEMHHFFAMRADKPAHPQMKEVAVPLLAQCISDDPSIFSNLSHKLEENHEYLSR